MSGKKSINLHLGAGKRNIPNFLNIGVAALRTIPNNFIPSKRRCIKYFIMF